MVQLEVQSNEPLGCLPMSLGLNTSLANPALKSLRIVSHAPDDYPALQLKGHECPVPAKVGDTGAEVVGTWPSQNRYYGTLMTLTELVIPATAAVLNMTDFECKPGCVLIPLLELIASSVPHVEAYVNTQEEYMSSHIRVRVIQHFLIFFRFRTAPSLQEPLPAR